MSKIDRLKPWTIIEIFWIDSMALSRWHHEDDARDSTKDDDLKHKTVGYFFKATKASIAVVQSKSDYENKKGNVDAVMQIPRVAITKVRILK